jgi:fructose-specific phosphotransferase system IIA component
MEKIITEDLIVLDLDASTKEEVIRTLASKMENIGRLNSLDGYIEGVFAREKEYATAIGFNVATPHALVPAVKTCSVCFAKLAKPIKWSENEEDEDVDLIFQIAVPSIAEGNTHLRILATLSRKLMRDEFRNALREAKTTQDVLVLIGEL